MLHGEHVVLRPVQEDDAAAVLAVLRDPEVACWWGAWDAARVRAELLAAGDEDVFCVLLDGAVVGLALAGEEDDPDYRHASIDVALGAEWRGRGLGADTVRTLARHLIDDRGHHRVTIDPRADNRRAIRCYERVGFRRVGVMRCYERGPDGTWRDGLLLDLLADDLAAVARAPGGAPPAGHL